jgi:RNA polymerase sigma-70 factor, ECF subfamily
MEGGMPSGEHDQYETFLRLFLPDQAAIRAFVRRLVPSRADADDILQETAVTLWQKFGEFHGHRDFKAWALGVARMKVLSWLRDRGRDRLVLDDDVLQLIADRSLHDEPALQRQREALMVCLEKVPSGDRDLLALAYQPDVAMQDVAAMSGRSVRGFYQWLYRTRQLLLDCVQKQSVQGEHS